MQKLSLIVCGLAPPLMASHPAEAGLLVSGVVGGSAAGAIRESFDGLLLGVARTTTSPSGLSIPSDGDAGGGGFGPSAGTQANGVDGTTYITAGRAGSVRPRARVELTDPSAKRQSIVVGYAKLAARVAAVTRLNLPIEQTEID
jgi:hypothetical protein